MPPKHDDDDTFQPEFFSQLVIMADRDTPFATLASVMDTIGEAGWDDVTFAVSDGGVLGGLRTHAPTQAWKESYARGCVPTYNMIRVDPEGFRITVFGNPWRGAATGQARA